MNKPRLFISYSRKNITFVRRLALDLERAGYDPWWDLADLRGGQAWAAEIEKQVRACDAVVVVLTPDSTASEWVGKETLLALSLKKPVIPIMLQESVVPLPLVDRQYVDFRGGRESAMQALIQALPALPQPIAGTGLSTVDIVLPHTDQIRLHRQRTAMRLAWLAVALACLAMLTWLARSPLSNLFAAHSGLRGTTTAPVTTSVGPSATPFTASAPLNLGATTPVTAPLASTPTSVSATTMLDYSAELMPVREQGDEGSGVGFAVAAALEYQIQKALGAQIVISPRDIYYQARLKGGLSLQQDTGAHLDKAIEVLQERGAIPEDAWPYREGEYAVEPPATVEQAPHYQITGGVAVHNVDELRHALRQYGPAVGAFSLFRDVADVSVASTGMIWTPDADTEIVGNLPVCFVGYDDGSELFKFRLSWGPDWGDQGYGYVSYDYVDQYLNSAWAISGLKATQVNDRDGAIYVRVPAGEFQMGSALDDARATPAEKPRHTASVDEFWIMQTEVTNAQYARCVSAGACSPPAGDRAADAGDYQDYPVAGVTWHQANDYSRWVGGRLPSEAEWEKACRGTAGSTYPWGDDPPAATLLHCSCIDDTTSHGATAVGRFPDGASPYGALDMAGNVWEWTSSLWGEGAAAGDFSYPYDAQDGRENLAAPDQVRRVLRGGSFEDSNAASVRCATRIGYRPDSARTYIGFRVVMAP